MTVKTGKYKVVLLDKEGFEIGDREADNLKQSKEAATFLLSDDYARSAETTHASLGTHKVEVRLASTGECIKDYFFEQKCMWFRNCQRPATCTTPHPTLGEVPTCQKCHDFATKG